MLLQRMALLRCGDAKKTLRSVSLVIKISSAHQRLNENSCRKNMHTDGDVSYIKSSPSREWGQFHFTAARLRLISRGRRSAETGVLSESCRQSDGTFCFIIFDVEQGRVGFASCM
jgi:hypothetical protein